MGEFQTNSSRKGVRKSKRLSTRVDLTPMVDLGFLLITFFIFTSALTKPVAMTLNMPDDRVTTDFTEVSSEKILTLFVSKEDRLFFYSGFFGGQVVETSFTGFRKVIREKKQQLFERFRSGNLTVLIKVTNEASYKNIVNCLDEMIISNVSTYMLLEPSPAELAFLKDPF